MPLAVVSIPSFSRVAKKLHKNDKTALDQAVKVVANNPRIGEEKKGALAGVFVHKLKLNNKETLLGYKLAPDKMKPTKVILLSVEPHENFYSDLKKSNF